MPVNTAATAAAFTGRPEWIARLYLLEDHCLSNSRDSEPANSFQALFVVFGVRRNCEDENPLRPIVDARDQPVFDVAADVEDRTLAYRISMREHSGLRQIPPARP